MKKLFSLKRYTDDARPSLHYIVSFKESGKRARRFFETKREAETFIEIKEVETLNQGREGAEFPTWLRVMADGCNARLVPHGKTIKDATDYFLAVLEASAKSCRVPELVAELLAAKRADGASHRYLTDLQSRLGRFARDFDGRLVATITRAEIDDWLRGLNQSPTSRNNFRRVLIVGFNFAKQRGYATGNPAESSAQAKVVGEAPGILTVSETARLMEACAPDVLPYVAIGAFAGLRPAEMSRLKWENIDFAAGLIEVTAKSSKTARRRFVKIQPNLAEWLRPFAGSKGAVCCVNLRKRLEATRRDAGLKEWPGNALRHGFASYHIARFNDAAALALEMGHTDTGMLFAHYRELVRPKDAAAFWQIRPDDSASGKVVTMGAAA